MIVSKGARFQLDQTMAYGRGVIHRVATESSVSLPLQRSFEERILNGSSARVKSRAREPLPRTLAKFCRQRSVRVAKGEINREMRKEDRAQETASILSIDNQASLIA